ncbi:MAG: cardiolipin synthase [Phycisphaerales bacterium]|nr:cardiolipin synthase [Phycisphaerales bacterium]MCB9863417.1 cardiolipin synthase [Phycisphaerales bacterium]
MPWYFWSAASVANYIAVILTIVHILRTRRDPRGMMAWILTLILIPFVGLVLFLLVGRMPMERKIRKRRKRRQRIEGNLERQTSVLEKSHDVREDDARLDQDQRNLMNLATRLAGTVVTSGNQVGIRYDGEKAFLELSLSIDAAKSHVHLMYYIYADDDTGRAMSDLLIRKSQQGVEVRLLLDAVGCWRLSREHLRRLKKGGVEVAFFMPWKPMRRRFQMNCRNHRKLCVVDGIVAFTGSKNIGDEYVGRKAKYGPWRDTNLTLRGPCVTQFQEIFAEDWHFATKEDLASDLYFPAPERAGRHCVQIVASGPDDPAHVLHQLLYAVVSDASESIEIITPYFVPDQAMMLALTSAAYRNVRVRLLLPSRTDSRLVLWAGRSFYEELLRAGIEIYEYDHGMLHAKTAVVDRRWSLVGSANMDQRSFRINFELTNILYDEELSEELHRDFESLVEGAARITRKRVLSRSFGEQIAVGAARLASPML